MILEFLEIETGNVFPATSIVVVNITPEPGTTCTVLTTPPVAVVPHLSADPSLRIHAYAVKLELATETGRT